MQIKEFVLLTVQRISSQLFLEALVAPFRQRIRLQHPLSSVRCMVYMLRVMGIFILVIIVSIDYLSIMQLPSELQPLLGRV